MSDDDIMEREDNELANEGARILTEIQAERQEDFADNDDDAMEK